jgi:uncharacterized protein
MHSEIKNVTYFFLLSCGWAWLYWFLIARPLGISDELVAQIPYAWGPLIAVVIITKWNGQHLLNLLDQVTKWRVHPIWYILAFLLPFVDTFMRLIAGAFGQPVVWADRPRPVSLYGIT